MRVWPYQMISVLPNQYLLGQWRECLAIAGMIDTREGINHATINRIKDYPIDHFVVYCRLIILEFSKRNFKIGINALEKLNDNIDYDKIIKEVEISNIINSRTNFDILVDKKILWKNFHNERYLKQCIYMFQEKYDCGMLTDEEWNKIQNNFKNINI